MINLNANFAALKNFKAHISFLLLGIAICFSFNVHKLTHSCEEQNTIENQHRHEELGHHHTRNEGKDRQQDEEKEVCIHCIISIVEDKTTSALLPFLWQDGMIEKKLFFVIIPSYGLKEIIFSNKLYKSDNLNKPPPSYIA